MSTFNPRNMSNIDEFDKFIDSNSDFLNQKYHQYFTNKVSIDQLNKNQSIKQQCLEFIYEVFGFSKYQNNQKLNSTLQNSLNDNLQSFIKSRSSEQNIFDETESVQLLKYCIQNNDMFAVHYDKKQETYINPEENAQKFSQPQQNNHKQIKQTQKNKNKNNQLLDSQQSNYQKQFSGENETINNVNNNQTNNMIQNDIIENNSDKISNNNEKIIFKYENQTENQNNELQNQNQQINQFQNYLPQEKKPRPQLIKKQLKNVFDFYCKQHPNICPSTTFDRISHHCQMMNLGHFISFAKNIGLYTPKGIVLTQNSKINKKNIQNVFKKHAKGKRQINFEAFHAIINQIRQIDEMIDQKLGIGREGIQGMILLRMRMKYISSPFTTKDKQTRELMNSHRQFIPKLTAHSGKLGDDLKQELQLRKISKIRDCKSYRYVNTNDNKVNTPKTRNTQVLNNQQHKIDLQKYTGQAKQHKNISINSIGNNKQISKKEYNFLQNLIYHDENDEQFLKDYQLPYELKKQFIKKEQKKNTIHRTKLISSEIQHNQSQQRKQLFLPEIKSKYVLKSKINKISKIPKIFGNGS